MKVKLLLLHVFSPQFDDLARLASNLARLESAMDPPFAPYGTSDRDFMCERVPLPPPKQFLVFLAWCF